MKFRQGMKISHKLIISIIIVSVALAGIPAIISIVAIRTLGADSLREKGASLAVITGETVKASVQYNVKENTEKALEQLLAGDADVSLAAVVIQSAAGDYAVTAQKTAKGAEDLNLAQFLAELKARPPVNNGIVAHLGGAKLQYMAAKIDLVANDAAKNGYLLLAMNDARISRIISTSSQLMAGLGVIMLVLGTVAALGISRAITKPLGGDPREVIDIVHRVAGGDLSEHDTAGGAAGLLDDESLLGAIKIMVGNLRKMFSEISDGVRTLSASATELAAISRQMTASAEHSSARAHSVATAAEEMSASLTSVAGSMDHATSNVSSVAGATEEMTSTINEVARSSDKARAITGQAVEQATRINRQVMELGRAAREIGKVTETIAAISAQTNLLALNATIEAARAGVAGKGFTVVAGEIKELAQQTAAATEGIREKIENIQASTQETVGDIEKISGIIQDVSEMISSTVEAIGQQSAVTRAIATNITQASHGIHEVNDNVAQTSRVSETIAHEITEANRSAETIVASSAQVLSSSEELARLAEQLKAMAGRFRL